MPSVTVSDEQQRESRMLRQLTYLVAYVTVVACM
jgi:hypothetical protein